MAFDFAAVGSPFRMQPGLRRLAPGAPQLTPLRPGAGALREKLDVVAAHAAQALLAVEDFDAEPALEALCRHAAAEHPAAFRWDGSSATALHLGWAVEHDRTVPLPCALPEVGAALEALPAGWRRAGLLALAFAEDFAVIDADSGRIPWLAVCFPSHWAPEHKVGRDFREVHAPVADNALLLSASAHLMRLVTAPDRWERFVWTITPHARLDGHPDRASDEAWPMSGATADIVAAAHWRTERQTFIPLPERRQAVFTIHVEAQPLTVAIVEPGHAAQVRDALASMSPAVLAYRGLAPVRDALLAWLDARAAT